MKQIVGLAGLALILLGAASALCLLWANVDGNTARVFSEVETGFVPGQDLYALECPNILGEYQTGSVHAVVLNPTDSPLTYQIQITAPAFTITGRQPVFTETISPGSTASFTWLIQPKKQGGEGMSPVPHPGNADRVLSVSALSAIDLSLYDPPSPSPSWSTSYDQGCGVGVIHLGGLAAWQAKLMSGISLVSGLILTFWWGYGRRAEQRKGVEN